MDHRLPQSFGFWAFLFSVDRELAATARQAGSSCGGRLYRADFLRKPRGGPKALSGEHYYRLSFCCGREGCRKRLTPPSVRFLGRKVYLHAVVILVAAMRQGPTPQRVRELAELFEKDWRTIERWQVFWREHFPQTSFWKVARGQLALLGELTDLPRALLTDNGSAMIAEEVTEGLLRLGIVHELTLPYSPDQNGKQECFWATLEGRLVVAAFRSANKVGDTIAAGQPERLD